MRRLQSIPAALLAFLLSAPVPASAADGAAPPTPPKDAREKWTVGFAALTAARLTAADSYLVYSIPLLLKDRVSGVPTHRFGEEEKTAHRRGAAARETAEQIRQLSQARAERDQLAFDAPEAAARRAELAKKTDALLGRIAELGSMDLAAMKFPDGKPVAFKDGGAQGNLFDPPRFSARELCRTADLDLLVLGAIEMVQGYLLIDLRAYDAALDRNVWSWREAAPREELYPYLEEAYRGLLRTVVGEDFAVLALRVEPPEATILLDGQKRTAGSLFTVPGAHVLSVRAAGYEPAELPLDLPSGLETPVQVGLKAVPGSPITLQTDPSGASVYVDSVWTGTTPRELDRPAARRHLELVKEGFLTVATRAELLSPEVLQVRLPPSEADPDTLQKGQRDRFYVAFGSLMVSLPVPVFLFVTYQDFAVAAAKAAAAQSSLSSSLAATASVCLWSAVGTSAACGGLLAYMIFTILDYVAAADRPAG